jgi:hypothetical protein
MHGFVEFTNENLSEEFMNSLENIQYGCVTKLQEINYKTEFSEEKMRYSFFFYSKMDKSQYQGNNQNEVPDSQLDINIPGLLVYHDFIS